MFNHKFVADLSETHKNCNAEKISFKKIKKKLRTECKI